jgi:hypothetical protein
MVITSKKTGNKYLTVAETEKLQRMIERYVKKRYKINIKTSFHPRHIRVPTYEGDY